MPARSEAQQHFMGMCSTAAGRKKAHGKCPPVSVAKEFAKKPEHLTIAHRKKQKGKR